MKADGQAVVGCLLLPFHDKDRAGMRSGQVSGQFWGPRGNTQYLEEKWDVVRQ